MASSLSLCSLSNLLRSSSLLTGLRYFSISHSLCVKKPTIQGPKQPGSPYSLFVKENFRDSSVEVAKYDRETANNRMRELSAMWRGMTELEKKPYTELFKTRSNAYNIEKERFMREMSSNELDKFRKEKKKYLRKKQKSSKIRKEKLAGIYDPPPRQVSGMNLYLSEQIVKEPVAGDRDTHRKRFAEICARWKTLSEEEKQPYIDEGISMTESRLEEYCKRHPEYRSVLDAKKKMKK